MKRRVLLDTGPLVALIRAQDQFHAWAKAQFAALEPPLLTVFGQFRIDVG